MSRSLDIIKRNISKLKDNEFTELRKLLSQESIARDLKKDSPVSYSRLYTVLKSVYGRNWWGNDFDYEQALKKLSEITEDEFNEFRLVGKAVISAAHQELSIRNISFKEKKINNAR